MVKELIYKIFGLEPMPCVTCEVLRLQLDESNRERRDLLNRLLDRGQPKDSVPESVEELKPVIPQYVPWRVRQQMLESEDREKARLMKQKAEEIEELEKEVLGS